MRDTPGNPGGPPVAATIHQIVDPQHGVAAITFECPPTWQAQSHLQWNLQHDRNPLQVFARAFDPMGPAMVEFFPTARFYWIEPYSGTGQQGEEAGGAILMRPLSAEDGLTRLVIPRFRGHSIRVMNVRSVPDLAATLNYTVASDTRIEGSCATIEYVESGRAIEEEFYALKVAGPEIPTDDAAGASVRSNWSFERLFSFRADRGQMAEVRAITWPIVHSFRANPAWEQIYNRVLQKMKQVDG